MIVHASGPRAYVHRKNEKKKKKSLFLPVSILPPNNISSFKAGLHKCGTSSCVQFLVVTEEMATWLGLRGAETGGENISNHEIGWWTNKIGGSADWICGVRDDSILCTLCAKEMVLVAQLYAPLENSPYHRTLYILVCTNECKGKQRNWRVLRGQCVDDSSSTSSEVQVKESGVSVSPNVGSDWCDGQDDWGDDGGDMPQGLSVSIEPPPVAEPQSTSVPCKIDGGASAEPVRDLSDCPKTRSAFTCIYVDVVEETTHGHSEDFYAHELALLAEYEKSERAGARFDTASGCEQYEKEHAKHGDKAIEKFQKVLGRNPAQCLRYRWPLNPLEFSDKQPLPKDLFCEHCSKPLHAEVQLMPPLLAALCPEPAGSAAGVAGSLSPHAHSLDFGTVVVFTCSASCWTEGSSMLSEQCLQLLDPDHEKLSKLSLAPL